MVVEVYFSPVLSGKQHEFSSGFRREFEVDGVTRQVDGLVMSCSISEQVDMVVQQFYSVGFHHWLTVFAARVEGER